MPKSQRAIFDIYIRVQCLEAIAGLPPRSWQPDRRGLMAAAEHFGGSIHPEWVSLQEQGIAQAVERKAHDKLPSEDAEELTSRILSGASVPSYPRGQAGAVALKIKSRVLRGESPKKTFKNMFLAHTEMRAGDVRKRENYRDKQRGQDVNIGEPVSDEGSARRDVSRSDVLDKSDLFLSDNPMVIRWVQVMLDRWRVKDDVRETAKAYFANPVRGAQTELARQFGVSKPAIKKRINAAIAYLTAAVESDPRILSRIQLSQESRNLSRMARMASKVATRYMLLTWLQRVAAQL